MNEEENGFSTLFLIMLVIGFIGFIGFFSIIATSGVAY